MAHCRGPGGVSVRTVTAGSSDWSPQLLQECLQVGKSSLTERWIMSQFFIYFLKEILHRDLEISEDNKRSKAAIRNHSL